MHDGVIRRGALQGVVQDGNQCFRRNVNLHLPARSRVAIDLSQAWCADSIVVTK